MAAKKASKSVSVTLVNPQEKSRVVRFDAVNEDDPCIANAYVSKTAIKTLGNPTKIKVTIEVA
jgi:hypothetical protein